MADRIKLQSSPIRLSEAEVKKGITDTQRTSNWLLMIDISKLLYWKLG